MLPDVVKIVRKGGGEGWGGVVFLMYPSLHQVLTESRLHYYRR